MLATIWICSKGPGYTFMACLLWTRWSTDGYAMSCCRQAVPVVQLVDVYNRSLGKGPHLFATNVNALSIAGNLCARHIQWVLIQPGRIGKPVMFQSNCKRQTHSLQLVFSGGHSRDLCRLGLRCNLCLCFTIRHLLHPCGLVLPVYFNSVLRSSHPCLIYILFPAGFNTATMKLVS